MRDMGGRHSSSFCYIGNFVDPCSLDGRLAFYDIMFSMLLLLPPYI